LLALLYIRIFLEVVQFKRRISLPHQIIGIFAGTAFILEYLAGAAFQLILAKIKNYGIWSFPDMVLTSNTMSLRKAIYPVSYLCPL